MSRTGPRRSMALLGTAALTIVLALTGCSSDSGDTASSGAADEGAAGAPAQRDAVVDLDNQKAGAGAPKAEVAPADQNGSGAADVRIDQRSIIYTGSMTVRVDKVDEAADRAVGIATGAGGFVGGDKRSSDGSSARATIQLRVPAQRFTSVLDSLAELGKQLQRDVNTEDVTEQTVDLDARIATQQARVTSGRRLLAQAKTLNELILLESEVAKREADLASLEAKKRRLADLTALSTITVTLLGPEAERIVDDEPETGFLAGLRGGWKAFLVSLELLLTVLGALVPWAIGVGVPIYVLIRVLRKVRRQRPAAPAPFVPAQARPPVPAMAGASGPPGPGGPAGRGVPGGPARPVPPAGPTPAGRPVPSAGPTTSDGPAASDGPVTPTPKESGPKESGPTTTS